MAEETDLASGEDWSDEEFAAAVAAYLEMLALEQAGSNYKKKAYNEALRQGALKKRTSSSVEYRMQNISAVLEELCLPRINGYRPAKHVGEPSKNKIKGILESQGHLTLSIYKPASDSELEQRVDAIRKRFVSGKPAGSITPQRANVVREVFVRDPLVKACAIVRPHTKATGRYWTTCCCHISAE